MTRLLSGFRTGSPGSPLRAHAPSSVAARAGRLGRVLPAVLAVALTCVVASCSSDDPTSDDAAASSARPTRTAASPTVSHPPKATSASPTPTLPTPADGTNRQACADGTCEIRVTKPVTVPLPARFGLGQLQVATVDDGTVTMVVTLTQSEFSSDGGCGDTNFTGPSADSPGFGSITCHSGEKVTLNKMSLTVVGVLDHAAVLRIRSAA